MKLLSHNDRPLAAGLGYRLLVIGYSPKALPQASAIGYRSSAMRRRRSAGAAVNLQ
jgi:hypothetical protein